MGFLFPVNLYSGIGKLCNKMYQNYIAVSLTFIVTFFWEHVFRQKELTFRPTIGINYVTDTLKPVFYKCGANLAHILAKLINWFDFPEIKKTLYDIGTSLFKFFTMGLDFFKGYFPAVFEYKYPDMVFLGTIIATAAVLYGSYALYYKFYGKKNSTSKKPSVTDSR